MAAGGITRTVVDLGYLGHTTLNRDTPEDQEPTATPIVRRGDIDPVQLRILNRILARATTPDSEARYADSTELLADVDLLLETTRVPASRRAVLGRLAHAVRASADGTGDVVALLGPSGVGKTYLLRDLRERLSGDNDLWVYDKVPQAGTGPYGSYASVLKQLLRAVAQRTGRPAAELLTDALASNASLLPVTGLLSDILADEELSEGIRQDAESGGGRHLDPAVPLSGVLKAVVARHEDGGAVLVLDDVQWTDDQSLAVFSHHATAPAGATLVFSGRPEAERRLPPTVRARLRVSELTEAESTAMLRALLVGTAGTRPGTASGSSIEEASLLPWVTERARGNPLAIVETVRTARQTRALSSSSPGHDLAEESVQAGLEHVPADVAAVLEIISLLFPPVPLQLLRAIASVGDAPVAELLPRALQTGLIEQDVLADEIRFRHDAVEAAVRRRALRSADRARRTTGLLRERVGAGDRRARYVLARILSERTAVGRDAETLEVPAVSLDLIPPELGLRVLHQTAREALTLVIPTDALRFAEAALAADAGIPDSTDTLELHEIAHEAAFLLDDPTSMSRHFRVLHGRADGLTINRARTMWISRSYAKLWIRGAVRIGWKVLAELGAVESATIDDTEARRRELAAARGFLARRRPPALYRRIVSTDADREPRSELLATTCSMLATPILTIDPERVAVLAHIILREALAHGPSPHAGSGFLMWSFLVSQREGPVRLRHNLGVYARAVADASPRNAGRATARHTIYSYSAVFALNWGTDHRALAGELRELHEQGMRIGSYEWASHAAHIYCQSLFYRGDPLSEVFDTMQFYRDRMQRVGVRRVSTALGKFQQAAECLLGRTDDPMMLTGSITDDAELLAEMKRREDTLGHAGYILLHLLLAAYGGEPERDYYRGIQFEHKSSSISTLYSYTVFWFFYGLAAWQVGDVETGRRALKRTRLHGLRHSGPHRIHALSAERARYQARWGHADRLYRRARREAIEYQFLSEAALIAERHGSMLGDRGRRAEAVLALHAARSLYLQWEAYPAAHRMEAAIGELGAGSLTATAGTTPLATVSRPGVPAVAGAPATAVGARDAGAAEALERTREYAQLLFSSVRDALLLLDDEGEVLFHNAAATPYVTIGADDSAEVHEGMRDVVQSLLTRTYSEQEQQETEYRVDGRTVVITASPGPRSAGTHVVAVVIRDVTTLRDRERELVIADRMASLGMLASTVAHEVGNPNHVLQLNAQTLQLILARLGPADFDGEGLEQAARAVENIIDGASRISEVVRHVTEYARDGREDAHEYIDPDEISRRVLRFTRLMVAQYTNAVVYAPEEGLPRIYAIRGRIEQALINLIKNACEALPDREAKVELRVERVEAGTGNAHGVASHGDAVRFAVCDQGPGIHGTGIVSPDGTVTAAFRSTRTEGTGLGLSIVNTIVEQHHGTFRFTRDADYASIAEIIIPTDRT